MLLLTPCPPLTPCKPLTHAPIDQCTYELDVGTSSMWLLCSTRTRGRDHPSNLSEDSVVSDVGALGLLALIDSDQFASPYAKHRAAPNVVTHEALCKLKLYLQIVVVQSSAGEVSQKEYVCCKDTFLVQCLSSLPLACRELTVTSLALWRLTSTLSNF